MRHCAESQPYQEGLEVRQYGEESGEPTFSTSRLLKLILAGQYFYRLSGSAGLSTQGTWLKRKPDLLTRMKLKSDWIPTALL